MGRRAVVGIVVTCVVIGGCLSASIASPEPIDTTGLPSPTVRPVAAPSQSARPTTTPSPTSEPQPTVPPDLRRTATKTRDDIRVTVKLQRNPLPAGERSWVKTRVENLGATDVTWFHDGCAAPVWVEGQAVEQWRYGTTHAGNAQQFKDLVLGVLGRQAEPLPPIVSFQPKRHLGRGSYGCADMGMAETIAPGEDIRETRWWTGFDERTLGLPPSGPVNLRMEAAFYWRGPEPVDNITNHRIRLKLDAWISQGVSPTRPTPPEIVDAALADPTFATFLQTQELTNGREVIAWYDAEEDRWEVGVMPWYETEPPRIHGVLLDAATGEVIARLDRPWIHDVDPAPY